MVTEQVRDGARTNSKPLKSLMQMMESPDLVPKFVSVSCGKHSCPSAKIEYNAASLCRSAADTAINEPRVGTVVGNCQRTRATSNIKLHDCNG